MRRRTLDVIFSTGGAAVAIALLVLAVVFTRDASFARNYVSDQLAEQGISFKPAEALTDEERQSECLVEYAGQQLTTGKQAECYANDFIGAHLAATEGANGMSYAELGTPERELAGQVEAARAAGDPQLPVLETQLAEISDARDTMFKGETLRGLLLTTFGFSVFGEKAAQAALVLYAMAGIMLLLSIAGLVHAYVTPRDKKVKLDVLGGNGHAAQARKKAPAQKRGSTTSATRGKASTARR